MTDPMIETCEAAPEAGGTRQQWPEDPIEMMNEMMREQANQLNVLFNDMLEVSVQAFKEAPLTAQPYLRLALRANANARSSMEAIARAYRARAISERMAAAAKK